MRNTILKMFLHVRSDGRPQHLSQEFNDSSIGGVSMAVSGPHFFTQVDMLCRRYIQWWYSWWRPLTMAIWMTKALTVPSWRGLTLPHPKDHLYPRYTLAILFGLWSPRANRTYTEMARCLCMRKGMISQLPNRQNCSRQGRQAVNHGNRSEKN